LASVRGSGGGGGNSCLPGPIRLVAFYSLAPRCAVTQVTSCAHAGAPAQGAEGVRRSRLHKPLPRLVEVRTGHLRAAHGQDVRGTCIPHDERKARQVGPAMRANPRSFRAQAVTHLLAAPALFLDHHVPPSPGRGGAPPHPSRRHRFLFILRPGATPKFLKCTALPDDGDKRKQFGLVEGTRTTVPAREKEECA